MRAYAYRDRARSRELEGLVREIAEGRMSRREFLEKGLALGFALSTIATVLAACGETSTSPEGSASRAAMETTIPDKMYFFDWADCMAPSITKRFKEETGIEVVMSYYDSNEMLLAKLQAGATGYDLINPQDYMASIMIKMGLLRPLDMQYIPNITGAPELLQHPPYDPEKGGDKYTCPLTFGTTAIGVRTDKVSEEITGWQSMWDPKYSGKMSMMDGARECFTAALFLLGYSPNTTDEQQVEEAQQKLIEQKPLLLRYTNDPKRDMTTGTWLTHTWDGDAIIAKRNIGSEKIQYVLPTEGYNIWSDAPSIPKTAANPYAAHLFLNFMLDTKNCAELGDYIGYLPCISASQEVITDPVLRDARPTDEEVNRGVFMEDVGEFNDVYMEAWRKVKSA